MSLVAKGALHEQTFWLLLSHPRGIVPSLQRRTCFWPYTITDTWPDHLGVAFLGRTGTPGLGNSMPLLQPFQTKQFNSISIGILYGWVQFQLYYDHYL